MLKLQNVLVTTDLSENAKSALPFAATLAKQHNAKLHLLYVEEPNSIYPTDDSITVAQLDWMVAERKEREQEVRTFAQAWAASESLAVVAHLKQGSVAKTIIATAAEVQADCIVMSTHGRSGMARLMFGSVTEQVLRDSACPVMCCLLYTSPSPRD